MIPLVLAATGRWRTMLAAAATVAALALAVTLAFGIETWRAFFHSAGFTRLVLEEGGPGWHMIQSVFSAVRMWGGPVLLAYAAQGIVTLGIAVALVSLWRSQAAFALKAAALCIATLLATPYSLDYDMMLLAPAIAFLAVDGIERGFSPYHKTALAALWLVPLVARSVAQATLVPLGVIADAGTPGAGHAIARAATSAPFPMVRRPFSARRIGALHRRNCAKFRPQNRAAHPLEGPHEAGCRADPPVRRAWLSVLPELLFRGRDRADAPGGRRDPQARAGGSLAREVGRAAHRIRGAQVQRGIPSAGASSAPRDPARADFRRKPLRPSVQAQRQGRVRRRCVAMAPGLRHLGARRRHAGAARDEHRGVPRRGFSVQRRADARPAQPQARHAAGRA